MLPTSAIKTLLSLTISVLLIAIIVMSCSDASLYKPGAESLADNVIGLNGRVCTDDPKDKNFPVRVLFLVDTANGSLFADYDSERKRIHALRETLALHGGNDAFKFAVVSFAGTSRLLAPEEGYFTRNPGELDNAVAMLELPQPCVLETCRDVMGGMELAQAIIEGDMTKLHPGELSRTQYVIALMTGGVQDPPICSYDCCDCMDDNCNCEECSWDANCTHTTMKNAVISLRERVESQGASSLSFHVIHMESEEEGSINGVSPEQREQMLQEMAFVGAGRYLHPSNADGISLSFDKLGLLKLSSLFEAKGLLVSNMSTLPPKVETNFAEGPLIDSDIDGLSDDMEVKLGTDPLRKDSDGDGIGDMLETLFSFDPTNRNDDLTVCETVSGPPFGDMDGDHLNDCEEKLLGTEPSLPDTDGDGITDWIEVRQKTDYLRPDADVDWENDGVSNGDEAMMHSNARSSDAASHLGSHYRYDLINEGITSEPLVTSPRRIQGVKITQAGLDTSKGFGVLRYWPNPQRLSWQDPEASQAGKVVNIDGPGTYTLNSKKYDPEKPEQWITISVSPNAFPPQRVEEQLLVDYAERHCVSFTVRNIRLVETLKPEGEGGLNDIFIYFGEAPQGRLTLPGLFRVAHIPVRYIEGVGREPSAPIVTVDNEEFVSIGY